MLIRPLAADDEPFLWDALYLAVHVPDGEAPPPPEIVREPGMRCYVAGWMQRPDDSGFAVVEAGVPVGAVWLRRWSGSERGYGFVDQATPELSMSLLPAHRGRGLGTRLLRHLLSDAAGRFAAVSLSVSATNPALRLYLREGFVPFGEPFGEPLDGSITMVRRLTPAA